MLIFRFQKKFIIVYFQSFLYTYFFPYYYRLISSTAASTLNVLITMTHTFVISKKFKNKDLLIICFIIIVYL